MTTVMAVGISITITGAIRDGAAIMMAIGIGQDIGNPLGTEISNTTVTEIDNLIIITMHNLSTFHRQYTMGQGNRPVSVCFFRSIFVSGRYRVVVNE
jgi:hypothetical protein